MLGPFVFKWSGGWSDGVGMRDVGERLKDYQSGFKSMWKQKQIFFYLVGNGPLLIHNISLLGTVGGGKIQKTMIRH